MPPIDGYDAAIAYLEEFIARPILAREQAGLARISALLDAVGHPERAFATIQVTGTNGKGSTTTVAAAILQQAGHRTGAFTSPHLQSYRERIAIDGDPIDEESWVRLLRFLQPMLERMEANELPGYTQGRPAFLEILWTMACLYFVERHVRCVVAEVGLGGRLDPTTVNNARVATITNVSLDHTERLGHTVEAIAAEKAGLIKPGQIVVSAATDGALAVIRATCRERGATLWVVGEDAEVRLTSEGAGPDASFAIHTPLRTHNGLRLGMRGAHQRLNAACAVGAADALVTQEDIAVPPDAVATGLLAARFPGRLEVIAGQPEILLDGAHNAAGAAALAAALQSLYAGRRIVLVLGILGDKDLVAITALLSPLAAVVIVTEPPSESRAGFAGDVAAESRRHNPWVEVVADPQAALARAQALAGPDDLVVVAGSLYLVGALRAALRPLAETKAPA